jgi:hypothetical protein
MLIKFSKAMKRRVDELKLIQRAPVAEKEQGQVYRKRPLSFVSSQACLR